MARYVKVADIHIPERYINPALVSLVDQDAAQVAANQTRILVDGINIIVSGTAADTQALLEA